MNNDHYAHFLLTTLLLAAYVLLLATYSLLLTAQASGLDPKSKEIRDMFKACQEKAADVKKGEKAMMAKMFG